MKGGKWETECFDLSPICRPPFSACRLGVFLNEMNP